MRSKVADAFEEVFKAVNELKEEVEGDEGVKLLASVSELEIRYKNWMIEKQPLNSKKHDSVKANMIRNFNSLHKPTLEVEHKITQLRQSAESRKVVESKTSIIDVVVS